jgi:hypothetical protein
MLSHAAERSPTVWFEEGELMRCGLLWQIRRAYCGLLLVTAATAGFQTAANVSTTPLHRLAHTLCNRQQSVPSSRAQAVHRTPASQQG